MLTRLSVHCADKMVATRQLERCREVEFAVGVGVELAKLAVDPSGPSHQTGVRFIDRLTGFAFESPIKPRSRRMICPVRVTVPQQFPNPDDRTLQH